MSKAFQHPQRDLLTTGNPADLGDFLRGPVRGAVVPPLPAPLEINGAPAVDSSHEFVVKAKQPLLVRTAMDADAPALAELLNAIIARGGTTALEAPFSPEQLAKTYLTGPKVISCFVAIDPVSGSALGFQTLVREDHLPEGWGDIGTFAKVDGTQRGVGTALFAATRARALELGLIVLNAEIRADNVGGLAFYARMGFEDHDVKLGAPLADGTPVDRIYKRYPLQAASTDARQSASLVT
jgi:RimJ/RimL family protein N-acetyltransferase